MLTHVNFMALSEKDNATSETWCCVILIAGVFHKERLAVIPRNAIF